MSDPFGPPDETSRPPSSPTHRDEPPPGADLPPIGGDRDPEPTRVMPSTGPTPATPGLGDPLIGDDGPDGPDGPGGPGDPEGPGGPGGPGDEPPYGDEPDDERPWYRRPGPIAAMIAGVAALVLGLVALLVARADDDTESDDTLPAVSSTSSTSSVAPTSTVPVTEPATTTSTIVETTTSSSTSTTSSTTSTSTTSTTAPTSTTTTTTTLAPTTTTTAPPTTTTAPPTTTTVAPTTTPPTTVPPSTLPPSGPNALEVMQTNPALTEFVQAIQATGLTDLVDGPEPVTVLAPGNDFIEPAQLTADQIRRQLLGEVFTESQLFAETTVETLNEDESLAVDGTTEPPIVGGVTILDPNVPADNGYIQVVNGATVAEP